MESFENDLEDRCVDFFVRDDGTFGFEEYRRDHEEGGRWSKVGQFSGTRFFSLPFLLERIDFLLDHRFLVLDAAPPPDSLTCVSIRAEGFGRSNPLERLLMLSCEAQGKSWMHAFLKKNACRPCRW